ncbi:uncharacterized protein K444DRAFT_417815 [Hyaloscypha bicolor E]|uniref:Uncharacterized protein n=1 Tax=Hyaloscypha bicolor E TaxID=1095630 RepID=A0A2J6T797_9HELO|nr:uncharacterized protein K444DRAFT_417815 [Hyaloscypha bicolor E]PMD58887.1 hypothetical protein K444DRAFT_417815 [Hyaloscypha bicolor E]
MYDGTSQARSPSGIPSSKINNHGSQSCIAAVAIILSAIWSCLFRPCRPERREKGGGPRDIFLIFTTPSSCLLPAGICHVQPTHFHVSPPWPPSSSILSNWTDATYPSRMFNSACLCPGHAGVFNPMLPNRLYYHVLVGGLQAKTPSPQSSGSVREASLIRGVCRSSVDGAG